VLVFELSGDYAIVVPLLLATVIATTVSRSLGSESVYEAELRRKGLGWELTLEGRRMTSGRPLRISGVAGCSSWIDPFQTADTST
jgi:hypothetical protein